MLLLAIQQDIHVNVPQVLLESMYYCVRGKGPKNWYFPRLIMAFLHSQGVPFFETDVDCGESRPISIPSMARRVPQSEAGPSAPRHPRITPHDPRLRISNFSMTQDYTNKRIHDMEVRIMDALKFLHLHVCPGPTCPFEDELPPQVPPMYDGVGR